MMPIIQSYIGARATVVEPLYSIYEYAILSISYYVAFYTQFLL